jgi:hypothetical protein
MDLGWFGVYPGDILCHYAANNFLTALFNRKRQTSENIEKIRRLWFL